MQYKKLQMTFKAKNTSLLPKCALADLGELFVFRKLITKRKLDSIVIFGHDGGLPVRPESTQTIRYEQVNTVPG